MKNTHIHILHYFRYLFVLSVLILSGCTHPSDTGKDQHDNFLQGSIKSYNGKIPENATVTLSLTQSKAPGEKENILYEYNLVTKMENLTIPFRIQLPDRLSLLSQPTKISIRVEKEGEIIMMSDALTLLPRNPGERLLLPVKNS